MKNLMGNYYNYILISAIISWCSAQILKTIINFIATSKFNAERLLGAGGMPSAHSAVVCAATVAVFRKTSMSSTEFAIIFIMALIVMYDAMGVRRSAGFHAKELNKIKRLFISNNLKQETISENENETKELTESLGHTPFEVLGGALLGILIAIIVPV